MTWPGCDLQLTRHFVRHELPIESRSSRRHFGAITEGGGLAVADHADQVVVVRRCAARCSVQSRAEKACAELRDLLVARGSLASFSRQSVGGRRNS